MDKETEGKDLIIPFTIEKPEVSESGMINVVTNFGAVKANIVSTLDKYKGLKLDDDNIEFLKAVKKQVQKVRTGIAQAQKAYKEQYFSTAMDFLDGQVKDLQSYVASVESGLDEQLEEYDKARKEELTQAYMLYAQDACHEYGLPEEESKKVVLDKKFYLKGAGKKEAELKAEIYAQMKAIKDRAEKRAKDEKVITMLCSDKVDPSPYLRSLDFKDISDIQLDIMADIQSAEEAKKAAEEAEKAKALAKAAEIAERNEILSAVEGVENSPLDEDDEVEDRVSLGKPVDENLKAEMTDSVITKVAQFTYRQSQSKELNDFMASHGIKIVILKRY